jgi:murein DD-endopeptidase MepM/ murein hydrolase activator NlpD
MVTALLVILIVPFLWSGVVAVLKRIPVQKKEPQYLDDKTEKRHLTLMLLSVIVGLAVAIAGRFVPMHLPLPALPLAEAGDAVSAPVAPTAAIGAAKPPIDWLRLVTIATATLYLAGLALQATRLLIGLIRLHQLAPTSRPAADWGQDVRLTAATASPLALGPATILLPESLLSWLSPVQTEMILRHEREHLKRGDSHWFIVLAVIDAVFWFNPFVRHQTRNCRLAAELACDAAVVAASPEMRGTYAEALVRVLKHAAGDVRQYAPTAFSPDTSGDYRMRISEIMRAPGASRKPRIAAAVAAALVAPIGLAQFAWAQTQSPAPATASVATPIVAPPEKPVPSATTSPMADIKPQSPGNYRTPPQKTGKAPSMPASTETVQFTFVPVMGERTTGFGVRVDPYTHEPRLHPGVDFNVATGTAVMAAAPGTIAFVGVRDGYGEVVEIDHGNNTTSRYAHLDSAEVVAGNFVAAGQEIGKSGSSGRSTGPHLHFEVWKGATPIDPATVLPPA